MYIDMPFNNDRLENNYIVEVPTLKSNKNHFFIYL